MHITRILIIMSENGERTVIQWIQILSIRYTRDLIVVPFQEAGLHSGVEPGEYFRLAYPIDVRRMRERRPTRVARVGG